MVLAHSLCVRFLGVEETEVKKNAHHIPAPKDLLKSNFCIITEDSQMLLLNIDLLQVRSPNIHFYLILIPQCNTALNPLESINEVSENQIHITKTHLPKCVLSLPKPRNAGIRVEQWEKSKAGKCTRCPYVVWKLLALSFWIKPIQIFKKWVFKQHSENPTLKRETLHSTCIGKR